MRYAPGISLMVSAWMLTACGSMPAEGQSSSDASGGSTTGSGSTGGAPVDEKPTYRTDVTPVTSVTQAKPEVFIPPFVDCRDPLPGEVGQGPGGKVCTNVAISGCTEPGKGFEKYASCDVVSTQRPFWPMPPLTQSDPNDPRLQNKAFMDDLAWVTQQVQASACVCCHDSKILGGTAGLWDIRLGPIWTDTLSKDGLALFTGLADSSVLGAYPPTENHGFDRSVTGIPSTDSQRMRSFFLADLARRGISQTEAAKTPPFGGPIYENMIEKPTACSVSEGVDAKGHVNWSGGAARYVYILEAASKNPGVPPNLDLPVGTIWKLDVLASAEAIGSGILYGTTPEGSFQSFSESTPAPKLENGKTYHLTSLRDVGLPTTNCLFTYQGG